MIDPALQQLIASAGIDKEALINYLRNLPTNDLLPQVGHNLAGSPIGLQDPQTGKMTALVNAIYPGSRGLRIKKLGDSRASQFACSQLSVNTTTGGFVVTAGGGPNGLNTATINTSSYGSIVAGTGMWIQIQATGHNFTGSSADLPYNQPVQIVSRPSATSATFYTSLPPGDYSGNVASGYGWQILQLSVEMLNCAQYWYDAFSPQKSWIVANYAIGGTVTANMVSWLACLDNDGVDYEITDICSGFNDVHNRTTLNTCLAAATTAAANINTVVQHELAKGKIVRIETPYASQSALLNYGTYGTFWNAGLAELQRQILAIADANPGVIIIDSFRHTIGQNGALISTCASTQTGDPHFQPQGGARSGYFSAVENNKFVQGIRPRQIVCSVDDNYTNGGTGGVYSSVIPGLNGTGGTFGSGGSGTAPTGWNIYGDSGVTVVATAAQTPLAPTGDISNAVNQGYALELNITTTGSGLAYMKSPDIHTKLVASQWYEFAVWIYLKSATTNLKGFALSAYGSGVDFAGTGITDFLGIAPGYNQANGASDMGLPTLTRIPIIGRFKTPPTIASYTQFILYFKLNFLAAGSADLQIQSISCIPVANGFPS